MILTKKFLNETVRMDAYAVYESIEHSKKQEKDSYDIFISYSSNDITFAGKVVKLLETCGYTVYVDYYDPKLDRIHINEETAKILVEKMKKCKGLLYLYSKSSSVSKWCPWEVGVFSGIKKFRCANLPIVDNQNDDYKSQEYLELYPYVEYEKNKNSKLYDFWVCESEAKYVSLKEWIEGKNPYMHS